MEEIHISKKLRIDNEPALSQLFTSNGNDQKSTLWFSRQFEDRDFRLIEVTDEILNDIIENKSACLKMIGDPKNPVVLCTGHNSFSVKKVETSNALFIVPPSASNDFSIQSNSSHYYELKNMPGKVDQLETLLGSSEYASDIDSTPHKELHLEDIEKCVQASKAEILVALKKLGVVELNGKMRMVSKQANIELTSTIFDTIIENNWKIESIDEKVLMANLPSDTHLVMVRHILGTLGDEIIEEGNSSCIQWNLDKHKVFRASAHIVFMSPDSLHDKSHFPAEEFIDIWATKCPGVGGLGLELQAEESVLLKGIAMKEHINTTSKKIAATGTVTGTGTTSSSGSNSEASFYRYFPEESLPRTPKERFQELFSIKTKFQLHELEPYLAVLFGDVGAGQCKTQAELLLKHTKIVDGFYYLY